MDKTRENTDTPPTKQSSQDFETARWERESKKLARRKQRWGKWKEEQKKKGGGVISALEGIKSKIDGLISESSDDDELRYHDCRELGEDSWPEYDAQGIYLCRVCKKCKKAKLSKYRKKILSGYDQSDVDEPIEETLIGGAIKHVKKDCKTLKRAEGYQDMLYNIYDKVKLVKSPKYSEDGEYVWEVGGKFLTKVPDDPMSIRRQPRPNLEDYADE